MKKVSSQSGFILPFAMITMVVASITIAALGGYAAFSSRMARYYIAQSRCRLAAQVAIETAKVEIETAFESYFGSEEKQARITPTRSDANRWFDYGDSTSIGTRIVYQAPEPGEVNGCLVSVWFGEHGDGIVQIRARASCRHAGGPMASSTIEETVAFGGIDQSPVFDNAYFVNNYGWMNGSTIVINGKMRANGNVSLSGSTVNGFIYAAKNGEVGAEGTISLSSSPQIKNASSYRSAYGNRSRPDYADYATEDAFDAPAKSGAITKPTRYEYDANGEIVGWTGGMTAEHSGDRIVNEYAQAVPMPFVSELDDYVEYARDIKARGEAQARLTAPSYSYTDALGATRKVAEKTIDIHYSGPGPSGDASLADNGALVLIGTQSNPIQINGPVVVDSDVIIKGYVKGQGTIYSGRNVHIIGDLKYVSQPTWSHSTTDNNEKESEQNATKDMLGLVAKGNIVIGDSSADNSTWHNNVDKYIKSGTSSSVVKKYACDPSDANIGYPGEFQGDYTSVENVSGQQFGKVRTHEVGTGEYETKLMAQYNSRGSVIGYKNVTVEKMKTEFYTAYDRCYYETVCDDNVLKKLKDSSGIAQIDAILYNNHGIFGTPGRSGTVFNLNGALVCRDEALYFTASSIRFNWDFRLGRHSNSKKDKEQRKKLGLPVGLADDTHTVLWRELADE